MTTCACKEARHACRLVVLTGGPGAGKTAVLEVVRKRFCEHIAVLPESATILFGGGFPRRSTDSARRAGQRAIFHVQRELERMVVDEAKAAVVLCDRGTLDGLVYWPGEPVTFERDLGTTREAELARYASVIHLRTPHAGLGYNHRNPVRTESAAQAVAADARTFDAWAGHPRRFVVESCDDFLDKLARVIALIRDEVPACCRAHTVSEIGEAARLDGVALDRAAP